MKGNKIQKTKLLIVEGNHEDDFFEAWLKHLGKTDVQPMPIGGKTLLGDNLKVLKSQSAFRQVETLVIVRDGDDNPAGAFTSVCGSLTGAGLAAPAIPWMLPPGGAASPRIGVLILPDGSLDGALEELLIPTVSTDPLYPHAEALVAQAVSTLPIDTHPRNPPPKHRLGKARVHAFLSTFEEPDKDQGKAALAGVWDFNHASLAPLGAILAAM